MGDRRGCSNCALLEREVAALERLVGRYQQELKACTPRRMHESLPAEAEELFESQQLDALQWNETEHPVPQLTKRNDQQCGFDQVTLPSSEWIWTSDWRVDVNSKTDTDGWSYASSRRELDDGDGCSSMRRIEHRMRRRRWTRQRKFIGPPNLPQSVKFALEQEAHLTTLQNANEKLTDQLRRANDQLQEYEDRVRAYEAQLAEMQNALLVKRPPRIVVPRKHDSTLAGSMPFSPSKSREVLHQTEALLSQILTAPALLDEQTQEAQRRRSQMVIECQSELDGAVHEFHSMVQTLDGPPRAASAPTQGA